MDMPGVPKRIECPKCGTLNKPIAKECKECGASLEEPVKTQKPEGASK